MLIWALNIIAITTLCISLAFLFSKKMRGSELWHATITPLASIIGSGFLVSGPLLLMIAGPWALLLMLVIVCIAYGLGQSMRYNIEKLEPLQGKTPASHWVTWIERLSRPALGIAYIISVAFYLKLLSTFALHEFGLNNIIYENILTTLVLLCVGVMGKSRGHTLLELLEIYSVNIKLAIIAVIIVSFFIYNGALITTGNWVLTAYPHDTLWIGIRKSLGMLIIIQGFETSRYMGYAYHAPMRIKAMRRAQLISGGIYLTFIAVAMIVINDVQVINETTIIELCRNVSPLLAILLIIAAIMSQFSAGIADTIGSAGLLIESSKHKISENNSYLLIIIFAFVAIWSTDIYQIIAIASKAFAIYYALQLLLTIGDIKNKPLQRLFYVGLLVIMILVVAIGIPVE